ncbi:MAG: RNA-directed DNA polymerase [Bacteroidales bacterium]|nr:RNA-directed DNA polymerase [Bacteroidales bacterium]
MVGREAFFPAAGNRNDTNLNNAGSNGNYWSSSLNTDNPNNAWNVNFNSDNVNRNNNNRYNGQSVRPVTVFTMTHSAPIFDTSPSGLLLDLYRAYKDARRHKRSRDYQLRFERNAESELFRLRDTILSGRYRPGASTCFIIHDPKMREVFAAQFRDRVVHHLLYNYIAPLLIPGFIRDSYSCIPGRGTHDGILRMEDSIRAVSCNYSRPCHILKLDIQGYFMHIDRQRLLKICLNALELYRNRLDFPLVKYLLEVIVLDDPTLNCRRRGSPADWDGLPESKSLFHSPPGCGLPIGNLTSQLFSNVYMDLFDKYMVSLVGEGRYGRYVDDAYVVEESKEALRRIIPLAESFLQKELGLTLSQNKIAVFSAYRGVEFLGAYLKPFRRYVGNKCLKRMEGKMAGWDDDPPEHPVQSINSFLGITSHYRTYKIRKRWICGPLRFSFQEGYYTRHILTYKQQRP